MIQKCIYWKHCSLYIHLCCFHFSTKNCDIINDKTLINDFWFSNSVLSIQQSKTNRLQGFMAKPFFDTRVFSHKWELRYIAKRI